MEGNWNSQNWHSFFDAIYIISLPKRQDRRDLAIKEMALFGIPYSVWPAIERENGAQGLKETMLEVFKNSIANGYDNILVFEDDVKFLESPNVIMPLCLEQLHKTYDMFFLGCNAFQGFDDEWVGFNLLKPKHAYGLHAVSYSSNFMKYIVMLLDDKRYLDKFNTNPLDVFFDDLGSLNWFCANPMLATQREGYSDIEKRNVNWKFALEDRFYEHTKKMR